MISTGLEKLDELLGGGIKNGIITDIFGASSTGKTQLVLQIAANSLSQGGTILYQDTTGSFRPERLLDMLGPKGLNAALLDKGGDGIGHKLAGRPGGNDRKTLSILYQEIAGNSTIFNFAGNNKVGEGEVGSNKHRRVLAG